MRRCLVVCPTMRPDMREEMEESFNKTAVCSDIIFDDRMDVTITEILNQGFRQYPNYDYYFIANDDILFLTDEWDKKLIECLDLEGGGIAFGDDGMQASNLCTFPMISGYVVRCLGWLQYPAVKHFFADNIWWTIGREAKCLYFYPSVKIDHRHWINQKRKKDDAGYDQKYIHDQNKYFEWEDELKSFNIKQVYDAKKAFVKERAEG